jgi:SAM-dependent methyltransferase
LAARTSVFLATAVIQRVSGWLWWANLRLRRRPYCPRANIENRLHLASGPYAVEGWTNLDYSIHVLLSRIPLVPWFAYLCGLLSTDRYELYVTGQWRRVQFWDLRYPLPFPDCTFNYIYSSHLFEHLFPQDGNRLFRECYRVLKGRGSMRVVVPDTYMAASQYVSAMLAHEKSMSFGETRTHFLGHEIKVQEVPDAFVAEFFDPDPVHQLAFGHAWMYDFWSLKSRLETAGFSDVVQCRFREGGVPDLELLDRRPDNSLHVECRKLVESR